MHKHAAEEEEEEEVCSVLQDQQRDSYRGREAWLRFFIFTH